MKDWRDFSILEKGDQRQKEVYSAMSSSRAMQLIAAFDPVVCGTYPIGIYLPDSDVDIICEYFNPEHFTSVLNIAFSWREGFSLNMRNIRGVESIIARFRHAGFCFEVFGQPMPVEDQNAYRHMLIEDRILSENDDSFKREILGLKQKGHSTEAAFAFLLGIDGDPYEGLLAI